MIAIEPSPPAAATRSSRPSPSRSASVTPPGSGPTGYGDPGLAFCEVVPHGANTDAVVRVPDSLRYQRRAIDSGSGSDEIGFLKVRYKAPDGDRSELLEIPIRDGGWSPSPAFHFGSAVVELGLVLRDSPLKGEADLERVEERSRTALGPDPEGHRTEFVRLVGLARELEAKRASTSAGGAGGGMSSARGSEANGTSSSAPVATPRAPL
ncbi:MAG TPA: YfbK domain-containing protein [Gemmatimonadota bacterium]|nr:YfbK domain-containing protein [Gemmatimonadota bacterium]